MNNEQNNGVGNITPIMPNNANNQNKNPGVNNEQSGVTTPTPITPIAPTTPEQQNNQVPNNNPTIPIPIVFPNTIVLGDVDVTNVSIIFDVFSVVIELDTW